MRLGERVGRGLLLRVRPPGDRRRDVHGRCSVCGAEGRFAFNSWILPPEMQHDLGDPRLIEAFAARESLFCPACTASLRVRRLVDVLLEHYAERATTLAELVREPGFRSLGIAEINSIGPIHPFLALLPRLAYSEHRPDTPPGAESGGVRNEDVCSLTYPDDEFDLVLSSDTLEHVADPDRGLRELRRVLKPGGRAVLTVPAVLSRAESVRRAAPGPLHLLPPQHHGRGSGPFALVSRKGDLLVYTDFGSDFADRLRAAGLEPEVHSYGDDPDVSPVFCGIAGGSSSISMG